ncbi:MAG TPA: peptide-methionine (S)-S-oxide reductase MsrA, partial [Candidatus Acidoferrum sp.]|nr:peptide-methionine (S)-S-oxide reductase MsrA [Candidatus Acidoferrum sp.]
MMNEILSKLRKRSVAVLLMACLAPAAVLAAEAPVEIAPPKLDDQKLAGELRKVVVAGGCFWGVQGVFQHVVGVKNAVSGYAGGNKNMAHYELVSNGNTGHAESVEITYDPAQVTYGQLLQVYFSVAHDPTQLNRQGPDSGTQYRSVIFYGNDNEKKIAESYIAQLEAAHSYHDHIVTRVDPLNHFYPAEDYHQDFLLLNPSYPYIVINDLPKVN